MGELAGILLAAILAGDPAAEVSKPPLLPVPVASAETRPTIAEEVTRWGFAPDWLPPSPRPLVLWRQSEKADWLVLRFRPPRSWGDETLRLMWRGDHFPY